MPSHMQNSLIFHYNLKFYGKDTDNYEGISLKRFVMQVENLFIMASGASLDLGSRGAIAPINYERSYCSQFSSIMDYLMVFIQH